MNDPVTLTPSQKRRVVQYLLSDANKDFFESCPDFWDGIEQETIDNLYPDYKNAVASFIIEVKTRLLKEIR